MDDTIQQFFSDLATPLGLVAVFAGLALALLALFSRGWRWIILGVALWASSLGTGLSDATGTMGASLFGPLEAVRAEGRGITLGLLLGLLAPSIFSDAGWRRRVFFGATFAVFVYELCFSGRIIVAGLFGRGMGAIAVYLLIYLVLARGVPTWIQDPRHILGALRAVALAAAIFAATNTIQLIVNRSAVDINGRFGGTAGNPQHAATCIAALLPAVLYLLARRQEPRWIRICLAGTVGLVLIMLAMTGSRTGVLMLLVALTVLFHKALGKFIKLGIVACVAGFLAMLVFPDAPVGTDRFISAQDTRSMVWSALFNEFLHNPIMGVMRDEVQIRESSYLSTAARSGLMEMIPLTIVIVLITIALVRLHRVRPLLGEYTMLADLTSAGLISIAVGALTEGYLLAVLSVHILLIYLYLAIIAFLIDYAEELAWIDLEANEIRPPPYYNELGIAQEY